MGLFKKLFIDGDWNIAIRKKKNNAEFDYSNFTSLKVKKGSWVADPLVYEFNDSEFLFCEIYDQKQEKGKLGVYSIKDGIATDFKLIIEENYHLSYPCVFYYNGKHYMIPESSENHTLNIYECTCFPYEWKQANSIEWKNEYADPTIYVDNNQVYLLMYEKIEGKYQVSFYKLNVENFTLEVIGKKIYDYNVGRPAGQIIKIDDHLYRPVQDCKTEYGKNVMFYEINFDLNSYNELKKYDVVIENIKVDNQNIDRIHTYSCSSKFEYIDYCKYSFNLFKRLNIIRRKIKTKKRNK